VDNEIIKRPWGTYQVLLDGLKCKVKKIVVYPNENPSYQYHHKRAENWIIIEGVGKVRLDDKEFIVKSGDSVVVPLAKKHTIKNISKDNELLVFIEVQTGEYFGEDDIVRLEDNYGRI